MRWFIAMLPFALLVLCPPVGRSDDSSAHLFRLSNLQVKWDGGSTVASEWNGKYGAQSALRVKVTGPQGKSESVHLVRTYGPEQYAQTDDAFTEERVAGSKTKSTLKFKSTAMKEAMSHMVGNKGGTVTVDVQMVFGTKRKDGSWDIRGELSNAQESTIEVPGK